jgi:Staphylococcal nuclease homologue
VLDGDTVSVLTPQKEQVRVRLAEIDAPEKNQPFGMKAKKMLSDLIFAKDVSVVKIDTDRYGRTVGRIYQGHTDVNLEMVKAGGAWAYTKYQRDPAFRPAEEAERAGKFGLEDSSKVRMIVSRVQGMAMRGEVYAQAPGARTFLGQTGEQWRCQSATKSRGTLERRITLLSRGKGHILTQIRDKMEIPA